MLIQALRLVQVEDVEADFYSLSKVSYDFEVEPYIGCLLMSKRALH
jgi:hypothetical protein